MVAIMNELNNKLLDSFKGPECAKCNEPFLGLPIYRAYKRYFYFCPQCNHYTVYPEENSEPATAILPKYYNETKTQQTS